jgi:hypothetical protein
MWLRTVMGSSPARAGAHGAAMHRHLDPAAASGSSSSSWIVVFMFREKISIFTSNLEP